MSAALQPNYSASAIGNSPGSRPTATVDSGGGSARPNLVLLAALACASEILAIAAAAWVSSVLCSDFVPGFHSPFSWLGLLAGVTMVVSIAERGDYGAGVMLDCGLRPLSLARASLQAGGILVLLAFLSIVAAKAAGGPAMKLVDIGGMEPTIIIVWVSIFLLVSYFAVLCTRLIGRAASAPLARPRRILVVGRPEQSDSVIASLQRMPRRSVRLLGIIDHGTGGLSVQRVGIGESRCGLPVLGQLDAVIDAVQRGQVDVVIVALPWSEAGEIRDIIQAVGGTPVDVLLAPDLSAFELPMSPAPEFADLPLLRAIYPPLSGWRALLKRAEDILVAGIITFLAAPAILAIAALVKLTSPGPVFFRQQRLGYNGQVFETLKFRTMYTHLSDAHATQQTRRGDARITPFGTWLRRKSLDELPQLLNVLRGDMSLVGPRPHAIGTTARGIPLDQAAPAYPLRHRVKPGLTGWAQVNGNRGPLHTCDAVAARVQLDLEYIRDWSLALDLKIIWLTIGLLIHDKNAY